jgi:hypothetical protein
VTRAFANADGERLCFFDNWRRDQPAFSNAHFTSAGCMSEAGPGATLAFLQLLLFIIDTIMNNHNVHVNAAMSNNIVQYFKLLIFKRK